ncbi:hypothetical protein [Hymenobacter sp. PAMC 26628]|uniref:hypothetical protein n=1 Tax=Hymenobacter sp. PAMC 26628 TaxID=1484118 RepID=UPI0012FFB719|nr:hypothetical protein [Hymenobacter sp. PAMC 26628]
MSRSCPPIRSVRWCSIRAPGPLFSPTLLVRLPIPKFSKACPPRATSFRRLALAALLGSAAPAGAQTKAPAKTPAKAPAKAPAAGAPQLGKATLKEVLGALTPEEKVQLVVGMGFYPSGFPAGMLPPGNPGDDKIP